MSETTRFLTIDQVSNLLQLHKQTVYIMAARGQLPAVRIGRVLRIDGQRLEAQLENQIAGQQKGRP